MKKRAKKGQSVGLRPKGDKKRRLSAENLESHPAMLELRRMIASGELDQGRTIDYLRKASER